MDDIDLKHAQLVEKLIDLTRARKLDWEDNFGTVQASVGDIIIKLESFDYDDSPYERVTICNAYGHEIESFSDGNITDAPMNYDFGYNTWWKAMVGLREMAKRQALKIDQTLDAILGRLDAIGRGEAIPKPPSAFDSDLDEDVPF